MKAFRDEPCHGCFGRGTIGVSHRPCAVCYDAEGECSTGRILSNLAAQDAPPFTNLILALGAAAYHVGLRGLAFLWGHPE